jgi:hypothetical protein
MEHDLFGKPVPTFSDHALAHAFDNPSRTREVISAGWLP